VTVSGKRQQGKKFHGLRYPVRISNVWWDPITEGSNEARVKFDDDYTVCNNRTDFEDNV